MKIKPLNRGAGTPACRVGTHADTSFPVNRGLLLTFLLPVVASAALFPDTLGTARRTAIHPAPVSDQPLWDEYGLQASEQATYESEGATYAVSAYRLQDSTGALAVSQWQRASQPQPGAVERLGNYVLIFQIHRPTADELGSLRGSLPRLEEAPLPSLPGYLPRSGIAAASERYITGPVGLSKFYPGIPASAAGFHLGAEAQLGNFDTPAGPLKLAIFSYPTNDIARDRVAQFQKIAGAMTKRTGPLVALILAPGDPNAAESLLSQVRYQASVTAAHRFPTPKDNVGSFMVNLFELIGVLLVFCALSGLAVGGLRMILRRGGANGDGDQLISLQLEKR